MVETFLSFPGAESRRQGLVHTRQVSYHWAPAGREPAAWSLVWGSSVTWHPSLEPSTLRTFLFTVVLCLCRGSPSHLEPTERASTYISRGPLRSSLKVALWKSCFISLPYLGFEPASSVWLRRSRLWSCRAYEFLTSSFQEPKTFFF